MEYIGLKIHVNVAGIKRNWEAKSAVKRKQGTPSGVTYLWTLVYPRHYYTSLLPDKVNRELYISCHKSSVCEIGGGGTSTWLVGIH